MGTRFTVISLGLLLIIETQCRLYQGGICKLDRTYLGDRKIAMPDGTAVQGIKVQFKPECGLRNVDEYRGLKYAEIILSNKQSLRFLPNRDPGRSTEKERYATNYKPVCPQKNMDKEMVARLPFPEKIKEAWVRIGTHTKNQSEECLWINLFVPYIGKL